MPGTDRNAPVADPDPTEDTQDPEDEEAVEAETQAEPDRDPRLVEKDRVISRQADELARLRDTAAQAEADDEGASDPAMSALQADSWTLAEQIYGADAVQAYATAADLLERAVTPADYMAAFEAYHMQRTGETLATEPDEATKPSKAAALTPKVDANRSDLSPDLQDAETRLSEARKGTSLADFTNAAAQRMGFGGAKRA